jgi:hypothetical protein
VSSQVLATETWCFVKRPHRSFLPPLKVLFRLFWTLKNIGVFHKKEGFLPQILDQRTLGILGVSQCKTKAEKERTQIQRESWQPCAWGRDRHEQGGAAIESDSSWESQWQVFSLKTIIAWTQSVWEEHLGYAPEVIELSRNWFAFNFLQPEHAKWVLGKNWSVNFSPLLLKPWSPLFDASREKLDKIPVWVRLPALPLQFWSLDYFKAIGNFLGDFLEADLSFEETKQRKIARILVNLNVREGLGEEIDLSWGNYTHTQLLDYENVPFRCRRCHQYGHLVATCHLPLRTKGGTFYREKLKSSTQANNSRQVFGAEKEASLTAEPTPSTEASKDKEQKDCTPPTERIAEEGLEKTSLTTLDTGSSRSLVSGNPLLSSPPITVLIKNLTLEGNEWLEALKNLSLNNVSQTFPKSFSDCNKDSSLLDPPPPPKRLCLTEEASSSSSLSNESSSTRYFLRSQKRAPSTGGLGKEEISSLDRGGRGRKSMFSKAQSKARIDLLAGKQQSIEWALRASKPLGQGSRMKIMSFNCRGLAGALKKPSLKRVIATEHPDVLLLQETMGVGEEVKSSLELLLPGWNFITVDAMGRSGGLATGWNSHNIQVINTWGLDSGLGITVLTPELKDVIHILNIYGPYQNKKPFWDSLLSKSFFKELLILGGDLNLSLGPSEVWGDSARPDPLADFFCQKFVECRLTDLDPILLKPTWKNNRVGIEGVAKRLDRFLINDSLLDKL